MNSTDVIVFALIVYKPECKSSSQRIRRQDKTTVDVSYSFLNCEQVLRTEALRSRLRFETNFAKHLEQVPSLRFPSRSRAFEALLSPTPPLPTRQVPLSSILTQKSTGSVTHVISRYGPILHKCTVSIFPFAARATISLWVRAVPR